MWFVPDTNNTLSKLHIFCVILGYVVVIFYDFRFMWV